MNYKHLSKFLINELSKMNFTFLFLIKTELIRKDKVLYNFLQGFFIQAVTKMFLCIIIRLIKIKFFQTRIF